MYKDRIGSNAQIKIKFLYLKLEPFKIQFFTHFMQSKRIGFIISSLKKRFPYLILFESVCLAENYIQETTIFDGPDTIIRMNGMEKIALQAKVKKYVAVFRIKTDVYTINFIYEQVLKKKSVLSQHKLLKYVCKCRTEQNFIGPTS